MGSLCPCAAGTVLGRFPGAQLGSVGGVPAHGRRVELEGLGAALQAQPCCDAVMSRGMGWAAPWLKGQGTPRHLQSAHRSGFTPWGSHPSLGDGTNTPPLGWRGRGGNQKKPVRFLFRSTYTAPKAEVS